MLPPWLRQARDRHNRLRFQQWKRNGDVIVARNGTSIARLLHRGRRERLADAEFIAHAPVDMGWAISTIVQLEHEAADDVYRRWLEKEVRVLRLKVEALERRR